jgi:hypothetical protein
MIVLITPTGGRPKQFELCMRWMKNQTYSGRVFWIVIDDCDPITTNALDDDFREDWVIIKKYPFPVWSEGKNTQARNLQIGIDAVKNLPKSFVEAVFIIEDDDYYAPTYLEKMLQRMKEGKFDVIGQGLTFYYDVVRKVYKQNLNKIHSSLFQTCFTYDAIPIFEACFSNKFIDMMFFRKMINKDVFYIKEYLSVGIKGLPGRKGIGIGHKMTRFIADENYMVLKSIIGDDYKYYIQ